MSYFSDIENLLTEIKLHKSTTRDQNECDIISAICDLSIHGKQFFQLTISSKVDWSHKYAAALLFHSCHCVELTLSETDVVTMEASVARMK